jgi:plasmid stability protein
VYGAQVVNLTLAIDEDVLRRARIKALERGTSVNSMVREFLDSVVSDEQSDAKRRLVALAEQSAAGSGSRRRTWTRDELHER